MYGVNLSTGSTVELQNDLGTNNKLNAIGFNLHDDYLYGFSYENQKVVRIDNEFKITELDAIGLPTNIIFFVGDISPTENKYYFYKKGSNLGLYVMSLRAADGDYFASQQNHLWRRALIAF